MRWTALTGAAFVIVFVVAVFIFGTGAGRQPAQIARYYGDHGDRIRQIGGLYALGIAVLLFVWFSFVLGRSLDTPLVLAFGCVVGALLLGAGALWAATAITAQHEQGFVLDPSTHLLVEDAGFAFFLAAMVTAIGFAATVSAAILRTSALPRILGLAGFAVAASLAFAWYYLPLFALLAWIFAVSVVLSRRRAEQLPVSL